VSRFCVPVSGSNSLQFGGFNRSDSGWCPGKDCPPSYLTEAKSIT
jgi:hypothetical protein